MFALGGFHLKLGSLDDKKLRTPESKVSLEQSVMSCSWSSSTDYFGGIQSDPYQPGWHGQNSQYYGSHWNSGRAQQVASVIGNASMPMLGSIGATISTKLHCYEKLKSSPELQIQILATLLARQIQYNSTSSAIIFCQGL